MTPRRRLRRGLLGLLATLYAFALSWGLYVGDGRALLGVAAFLSLQLGFIVGVTDSDRPYSRWSPHAWLAVPGTWLLGGALLLGVTIDLESWLGRLRASPGPSGSGAPFIFSAVIALAAAILGARAPQRPLERRGVHALGLLCLAAVVAIFTGILLRLFTTAYQGAMFDLYLPLVAGAVTLAWCALPALCLSFVPSPSLGAGPSSAAPEPIRFHLSTLVASMVFLTCAVGACVGDPRGRTDLGAAGIGLLGSLAVCFLAYRFVAWVSGWESPPS